MSDTEMNMMVLIIVFTWSAGFFMGRLSAPRRPIYHLTGPFTCPDGTLRTMSMMMDENGEAPYYSKEVKP